MRSSKIAKEFSACVKRPYNQLISVFLMSVQHKGICFSRLNINNLSIICPLYAVCACCINSAVAVTVLTDCPFSADEQIISCRHDGIGIGSRLGRLGRISRFSWISWISWIRRLGRLGINRRSCRNQITCYCIIAAVNRASIYRIAVFVRGGQYNRILHKCMTACVSVGIIGAAAHRAYMLVISARGAGCRYYFLFSRVRSMCKYSFLAVAVI